ncbi:MAG: DUF935 family protein [Fimbriimonadaceae bacterium]|nr:DUF935 family protein [Fimbriimonadaceae bacterium]
MKLKLFQRRSKNTSPLAPSLTQYDRRALELPSGSVNPSFAEIAEMERDAMVQTALTIKKQAVLAADFKVVPATSSTLARRNALFVEKCFELMEGNPRTILADAMDAFARGWSVLELDYLLSGDALVLERVSPKNPLHFGLEADAFGRITELRMRVPGEDEITLPRSRFVLFMNRPSFAHPKGRSDLIPAWRHYEAKRALQNAWRAHLERFASPTVLGRYARGLPSDEQASVLSALRGLHENTAVVFPSEIEVSTLHGRESDNNAFQDAIEFHNREIARSILGQTLTTDEGRRVGSLALGKVHLQVLMLQIEAIRRELADLVMTEQVIRPLVELNFGPGDVPRFEFEATPLSAFRDGVV